MEPAFPVWPLISNIRELIPCTNKLGGIALLDMRTDKPFRKSFVCGTVAFVALVLFVAVSDTKNLGTALMFLSGLFILIALLTGVWSFFSKKPWSWSRFAVTIVGFFLFYVIGMHTLRAIKVTLETP